jgi:hypothetical protein
MSPGASLEQAPAELASSFVSLTSVVSLFAQIFASLAGGYVAACFGRGMPLRHAAASGAVFLLFVLTMYLNPGVQAGPIWSMVLTVAVPVLSSLSGGFIYARRRI